MLSQERNKNYAFFVEKKLAPVKLGEYDTHKRLIEEVFFINIYLFMWIFLKKNLLSFTLYILLLIFYNLSLTLYIKPITYYLLPFT